MLGPLNVKRLDYVYLTKINRQFALSLSEQVLCYFHTLSFIERLPTCPFNSKSS